VSLIKMKKQHIGTSEEMIHIFDSQSVVNTTCLRSMKAVAFED
jgi:hypothetical protein